MKWLWLLTGRLMPEKTRKQKTRVFLPLNCVFFGLIGLLVWLVVRLFALDALEWAVCFVGFPLMLGGFFGGIVFLMNHDDPEEE